MNKTLQTQYLLIQEGKGHKGVFLADAKRQFPQYVRNAATYEEAVSSLKTKSVIKENFVGLEPIVGYESKKKESFETAFESFLAEARKKKDEDEKVKAEEKKVSKPVEEDLSHNYDYKDDKNPDNLIFDQVMMGYYAELKDPKNADKTMQQLKDIVLKNLAKDPIHYTKDGQFGVKDLGYVTDHPGLGEPKEPKGKYASSGYGNLNESQEERDEIKKSLKKQITEPSSTKKSSPEEIKASLKKSREKELKRRKEAGESLEELQLREVLHEIIDTELNEIFKAIGSQAGALSKLGSRDSMDAARRRTSYDTSRRDDEVKRPTIHDVIVDLYGEEFRGLGLADDRLTQQQKDAAWAEYKRIHGELEEAYQMFNVNPSAGGGEGGRRFIPHQLPFPQNVRKRFGDHIVYNPVSKTLYISQILYNNLVKGYGDQPAIKKLIMDIPPMVKQILNKTENYGLVTQLPKQFQTYFPLNAEVEKAKADKFNKAGTKQYWSEGDFLIPNLNIMEGKIENLLESVEKDLAAINKEAEYEVLQSKLDKIDALIDSRKSKLNKLDEDEDMKALTDKKKVKELEKDIKTLEKAKSKVEKMLAKKAKNTPKKKQVIDEDEPIEEATISEAPPTQDLEAGLKTAQDMKKELEDMAKIELEEEDEMAADAPEGYLMAKADAEKRMDAGEELDSILSDYPEYRDELELDMMGKYDGMDY